MRGQRLFLMSEPRFARVLFYVVHLTHKAVRLVAVEALRVCIACRQLRNLDIACGGRFSIRFLTIGTCFLAATILNNSVSISAVF